MKRSNKILPLYLQDAKKHLGQLASFGIGGNLVKELGGSSSTNYDDDDDDDESSSSGNSIEYGY